MIPLAEMSRLAGRIFPCFHMGLIPPAEMKFYHWRLRNVFISVKKHNYLAILEYLFSKKSIALATYLTLLLYSTNIKL